MFWSAASAPGFAPSSEECAIHRKPAAGEAGPSDRFDPAVLRSFFHLLLMNFDLLFFVFDCKKGK